MKPEHYSSAAHSFHRLFLMKRCVLIGGLGLAGSVLIGGPVSATAEADRPSETATPAEAVPPISPIETSAEVLLRPQVSTAPAVEPSSPAPQLTLESPGLELPAVPAAGEATPSEAAPTVNIEALEKSSSVFIDPTDYSLGATPSAESPAIVFSDRSTGCQFTLQQGQTTPSRSCAAGAPGSPVAGDPAKGDASRTANGSTGGSAQSGFSIGPVGVSGNGITVGGTTVISREYFNERLRPLNLLRQGVEEFVFPLASPAPITSLFGWRTHPIFGDRRFHSGTDLGAPEGTPVVATKDGEVHVADYLGGYGLTVILRHDDGALETRYAHLSQILVRPGEKVQQGEVVGLVGSTGNSTGPHLHFELRELTAQGWILINPDELMGYTVASLVDAINHPLQAFGLAEKADDDSDTSEQKDLSNLPYRPAQPNAN